MKKLIYYCLFMLLPAIGFCQVTPMQIDACKGVANGQDSYSVSITCNAQPTSPYQMEKISVTYTITNTGASTLRVNNMTARGITLNGSALSAGDIQANEPVIMIYNNITSKWAMMKPAGSGGVAVSAVTASTPLTSSGGTTPNITITKSGSASNGYLDSTDWKTFNNKVSSQWNTAASPTTAITYTVGNVGIGTSTVSATLHVASSGSTSATSSLKINNSIGSKSFLINDAGELSINRDPLSGVALAITGFSGDAAIKAFSGGDWAIAGFSSFVAAAVFGSGTTYGVEGSSSAGTGGYFHATSGIGLDGRTTSGNAFHASSQTGVSMLVEHETFTLSGNSSANTATIFRNTDLNGHDMTGSVLQVSDATTSTGKLFQVTKLSVDQMVIDNAGSVILLKALANGSFANNAAAVAVLGSAGAVYYTDVAGEYTLKITHP